MENGLCKIEWGLRRARSRRRYKKSKRNIRKCKTAGVDPFAYGSYYRLSENTVPFSSYLETAEALGSKVIRIWAGTKSPNKVNKDRI